MLRGQVSPKLTYSVHTILIKVPAGFFHRNGQSDLKIYMENEKNKKQNKNQQTWKSKTSFGEKRKRRLQGEDFHFLTLKLMLSFGDGDSVKTV